ncbi:GNAT family N-acetyltransferase [Aquihabitans sp. G128]|uniref:GNAT family N-acetyltransferase n=1 Tax=Aquihabitans sp. G128 TaxID=2849779 RepID=UPI001C242982|nr:GNAT family N-acetyltransferase [Aquihabitans sp. G128]QXC59231.1 GNAT family N-acetyltransferase [Aquihabitans sp. G128]
MRSTRSTTASSSKFLPAGAARRRALAVLLASRRVVVVEEEGVLVGAMRCELRTGRHDWWSGYTVPAEHRRRGIGRALERQAQGVSFSLGHRMAGVTAPTNPIPYPASFYTGEDWIERGLPPAPPSNLQRARRKARRTVKRWRR